MTDTTLDDQQASTGSESTRAGGDRGLFAAIWRSHFYAGIFTAPVLLWFAFTGLIILYAGPLDHVLHGNLNYVTVRASTVSLADQVNSVQRADPKASVSTVTPPARPGESTVVVMSDAAGSTTNFYVDPYTGQVLGSNNGDDLVAFAHRTHGSPFPRQFQVKLPTLLGVLGQGATMQPVEIGEIIAEVAAGWGLVLAVTGISMWWPRKRPGERRRFLPSFAGGGRKRLRGMHTTAGLVLSGCLFFSMVSGLPWASFWGPNWQAVAAKITPNKAMFSSDAAPNSSSPKLGSLTRFGEKIPWAASEDKIPNSNGSGSSLPPAQPVSIAVVERSARASGMAPNAVLTPPSNAKVGTSKAQWGTWVVTNPWPSSIGQQGAIYIDQFSGKVVGRSTAAQWGLLQRITEFGVQTHMGTQFGLWTRLFMTAACLLVLWNVTTALLMWRRRRRGHGTGFPRRPRHPGIKRPVGIAAIILAVLYPLWGASLVLVLLFDHFVVQRIPPLRRLFGMRDATSTATPALADVEKVS